MLFRVWFDLNIVKMSVAGRWRLEVSSLLVLLVLIAAQGNICGLYHPSSMTCLKIKLSKYLKQCSRYEHAMPRR